MSGPRPSRRSAARASVIALALLPLQLCLAEALRAQPRTRARSAADSALKPIDALIGTVVDVIGRPMADIDVYLARTDRSARTDARGMWRIQDPPVGPHVVVARSIGYVPYVREVIIGSAENDTVAMLLRRYPPTLSRVEITARTNITTANASVVAERLTQMKASAGRLYTRDQILELRPYSVAELVQGVPGIVVQRGRGATQGQIIATSTRAGVGILNTSGEPCQLQFYIDNQPVENEGVASLDPLNFRSVEVYPQTVLLPGLPMRPNKCGAVVINMMRR